MKRILIVEDESSISDFVKGELEYEGYEVCIKEDGRDGLEEALNNEYDLVILDIMLPSMNGFEICRRIKRVKATPVIMLSAKSSVIDKVNGLKLGADDYITKPFNPLEVIAYVEAILRRFLKLGTGVLADVYKVGNLSLEMDKYILRKEEEIIPLTSTEMKMMVMFMQNPNRVFTKSQIYEYINGDYCDSDDNTMMVHISNLRSKIESDPANHKYILTVRGLGYKLVAYEEK